MIDLSQVNFPRWTAIPNPQPAIRLIMLANVALPAFLPHSLATLIGIFIIAAIEGWFVMRVLKLSYCKSYRLSLSANWMSTIAGIPVAWLLWLGGLTPIALGLSAMGLKPHPAVSSTVMQTAFSGGTIPTEWMDVGSAVAWIVMLVPFWIGSVWIESRTIRGRLPACDPRQVSKAVVQGNLASYAIFLIFGLTSLANALADLPHQKARFKELRERKNQIQSERVGAPKSPPNPTTQK